MVVQLSALTKKCLRPTKTSDKTRKHYHSQNFSYIQTYFMSETYGQTIQLPRQLATNKTINGRTSAPCIIQHLQFRLLHSRAPFARPPATEWYSVSTFIPKQSKFVKLPSFKTLDTSLACFNKMYYQAKCVAQKKAEHLYSYRLQLSLL